MNQPAAYQKLRLAIREFSQPPEHPALTHMIEALQDKYREQLTAILFYGSCLRSGDPYDGLVDLYLVVDRYADALHITRYDRPHDRDLARDAAWLELMQKTAAAALEIPNNSAASPFLSSSKFRSAMISRSISSIPLIDS